MACQHVEIGDDGAVAVTGILSFGAYLVGLTVAGVALALTILVGPLDAFAVQMIVGPAALALVGVLGIRRAVVPARRLAAALACALGAALAGAVVAIVAVLVPR
jgi:hypothetical protein